MASAPIYAFPEVLLTVLRTIFFPRHWLLSDITIIKTMDSRERGMNSVTMTSSNLGKNIGQAAEWNHRPPVLKPCMLPTELSR